MYGDQALKLIRELKRFSDSLAPYNVELVQGIQRETIHLFSSAQSLLAQIQESQMSQESVEVEIGDTAFLAMASAAIARNKRCLLAYIRHRREKIQQLVWDLRAEGGGNRPPPAVLEACMSAEERQFFRSYSHLIWNYRLLYEDQFDLTSQLIPPRSLYVHVRATRDLEYEAEDGSVKILARGHTDFVKRASVERFIEQGYLVHVE